MNSENKIHGRVFEDLVYILDTSDFNQAYWVDVICFCF